ncbi:MAG: T9SS type A sorting domain-containing protein [Cryomorphaceae bacterium]
MKYYLPLLTILIPTCLIAQEGMFDNPESEWYLAHSYINPNAESPAFTETRSTVFAFDGDTLISGDQWQKLFTYLDKSMQGEAVLEGILRVEGDLVLYRNTTGKIDTLYNFGLGLGDHYTFKFDSDTVRMKVINVDEVKVNGQNRKRIIFGEPDEVSLYGVMKEVWIEGVGSVHGPLFPCAPRMFSTEFTDALDLTCARIEGKVIWNNTNYEDCYVANILSAESKDADTPFSVYPNPFHQEIYLDGPFMGGAGAEVRVYDMQGRKVHNSQLPVGKRQLSLNGLGSGVYLLEIAWEGESYFQKIVK